MQNQLTSYFLGCWSQKLGWTFLIILAQSSACTCITQIPKLSEKVQSCSKGVWKNMQRYNNGVNILQKTETSDIEGFHENSSKEPALVSLLAPILERVENRRASGALKTSLTSFKQHVKGHVRTCKPSSRYEAHTAIGTRTTEWTLHRTTPNNCRHA